MKWRLLVASAAAAVLAACGGGEGSGAAQAVRPVAQQQQAGVDPTTGALRIWQAFYGRAPTVAEFNGITTANPEVLATSLFTGITTTSDAALATAVLANMGVTAQRVNTASLAILQTALTQYFGAYGNGARGVIANNLVNLLARLDTDATWGAAASAFNTTIANARTSIGNATPGNSSCAAGVAQGFRGDIEVTPADAGAAGSSGTGGDGGGAAAGGGLGKVLGGMMTVVDLATGNTVGQAITDSASGLVTIRTCSLPGPFLVVLEGRASARYFDEGRNALVDFPAGTALHAMVTGWNEHVGVSPYTEAATRFAVATFRASPGAHALSTAQVRAALTGLTTAQVAQANATVLGQMNVTATQQLRMESINTLPKPIDASSTATAFAQNKYGVAGTVLGGFVAAVARYAPSEAAPALAGTKALAEDLTDGVINGWSAAGQQVRAAGSIESQRYGIATAVGQNIVASRFGSSLFNAMPDLSEVSAAPADDIQKEGRYVLRKDGTVTVAQIDRVSRNHLSGVSEIGAGFNAAFAIRNDGTVAAWGRGHCGLHGDGTMRPFYLTTPVAVANLRNVKQVVSGNHTAYALDANGDVWSWGADVTGSLGLPASVERTSCVGAFGGTEAGITRPVRIPTLSNVRAITAGQTSVFAITNDGRLYEWGGLGSQHGFTVGQSTPALVAGLSNVVQVTTGGSGTIALLADGSVFGWGMGSGTVTRYLSGGSGDGVVAPRRLHGLEGGRPIQVAGDLMGGFAFLYADGTLRHLSWNDGAPAIGRPVAGSTRIATYTRNAAGASVENHDFNGSIAPIRQIATTPGDAWVYTIDGNVYRIRFGILPIGFAQVTPEDVGLGILR